MYTYIPIHCCWLHKIGYYWKNTTTIILLYMMISSCIKQHFVLSKQNFPSKKHLLITFTVFSTLITLIYLFKFLPTWICVSLPRATTSSEWKLLIFAKLSIRYLQILKLKHPFIFNNSDLIYEDAWPFFWLQDRHFVIICVQKTFAPFCRHYLSK